MELDALFSVDSQTSNMSDTSEASDDKDKTGDICRDYLRNVCKRGKRCRYRHPHPSEAQKLGRRQEYTFCHDFQNAGCHRTNCKFIHCTREEEEYYKQTGQLAVRLQQAAALCVGAVPSELPLLRGEVPICKDFLKGDCKRAAKCKYRHLNSTEYQYELRRPTDGHLDAAVALTDLEKPEYEAMPTAAAVAPMTPFKRRRLETEELENGYALANHTTPSTQVHNHNHMQAPTHPQPAHALSAAAVNHLPTPPHNPPPQPTTLHPTVPPPPHIGFRSLPAQTANYHLLEEENALLRRKIEELKKQVSDLAATNEVLLEQNARFRSSKNNAVSSAPPVVTVSQVVTPTISPAAAVARPGLPNNLNVLNVTLSQLTMTANSELVISRMGQPIVPQELTAQTLGPAINPPVSITTQTIVPMSLGMESIAAAGPAALPPVAASMAPVAASMGQPLGIVSQPQTSMTPSMLSGASTAMISYPIMSHTQLPTNSLR